MRNSEDDISTAVPAIEGLALSKVKLELTQAQISASLLKHSHSSLVISYQAVGMVCFHQLKN